jgi:hypothetical protein
MRQQLNFKRSMRLWQPMLSFGLREDILIGKYARHYKHRLTAEQFLGMLRATSISVSLCSRVSIDTVSNHPCLTSLPFVVISGS